MLGLPRLTLLATCTTVEQGIEQQLEGSRGPQVVEQLQDVGLWQEPFAPIEGLQRGSEGQFRALPNSLAPPCPSSGAPTPTARTHRGLGSNESSQHAAARGPGGAEGDAQMAASQGQAVCPLLGLLCHLCRLILQHSKALQLPVLAICQLWRGEAVVSTRVAVTTIS